MNGKAKVRWGVLLAIGILALAAAGCAPSEWRSTPGLGESDAAPGCQQAEGSGHQVVSIAAGEFVMGSDSGRGDERPQHLVYLDAYEIDRCEVTNAQYQLFLRAVGGTAPPYWNGDEYPLGQADFPVVGISWADANAYCAWVGMRLPTEAEWEKACRGTDGRIYPWGDAWEPQRANVDPAARRPGTPFTPGPVGRDAAWPLLQVTPAGEGHAGLRPVGSYPAGASPYGVMDLSGNASEWVSDWYNWDDYTDLPARNPQGLGPPWNHSVRGSPWANLYGDSGWAREMSRCSARSSAHIAVDPRIGFRCARSVP